MVTFTSWRGELAARRFEIGGAARSEMQVAAFRGKRLRDAEADSARAAGDERGTSFELQVHDYSL